MVDALLPTARLELRPYDVKDVAGLHRLWTEPGVRRYLWDDVVIPVERALQVVESSRGHWETAGYGQWTVRLAGTSEIVGFCGFRPADWQHAPELLYGLATRYWGCGYAYEAAMAVLEFGFTTLGFSSVVAATDAPNAASVRLMERIGMTFERRGSLNGLDTLFYELTRHRFLTTSNCG